MKPFSTYPEDREQLLRLAREIDAGVDFDDEKIQSKIYTLADLVKAILEDEEVAIEIVDKE